MSMGQEYRTYTLPAPEEKLNKSEMETIMAQIKSTMEQEKIKLEAARALLKQAVLRPGTGGNDVNFIYADANIREPKFVLPEPDFSLDEIHKAQELIREN
jgi:hypothetical protein